MEHLHADTLSFTVFYDTVRHYGKSGRYTDTGIYSDTGKLTKIFLLNVKTGEKGEVVSKDSAVRGWDFSSWIDGMYVGTTMDGDIRHWSPIDSLWHALPASYSGYPRGQVIEYRGALYSPQWSSVLRSRAGGAWEEIAIPGRFPSGSKTLNWGDIGQLQAIGDTLYALGSSVRIFDPATNIFKEVAGEFTSGDLPPKSAYCKGNRGCFNMGFGWNLAKFGDTIYFGTSQGLWKISLSKAVVCDPMAYGNNSDICGIVALQEQCIWDYEYCCKYQHVDSLGVCKEYVCPAARAASGILNPLQSR